MSRISGCSAIAVHTDTIRVDASKHPRNAQPAQPLHLKFLIDASDVTIMNRAASTTTNRTKLHVGDVSSMASRDDIGSMTHLDRVFVFLKVIVTQERPKTDILCFCRFSWNRYCMRISNATQVASTQEDVIVGCRHKYVKSFNSSTLDVGTYLALSLTVLHVCFG